MMIGEGRMAVTDTATVMVTVTVMVAEVVEGDILMTGGRTRVIAEEVRGRTGDECLEHILQVGVLAGKRQLLINDTP
jgi:hypothetical protein